MVIHRRIIVTVLVLIVAFVSHAIDVQVTATGGLSGPGCGTTVIDACDSLKDAWSACQNSSSEPCNMYLQPGHYVGPNNAALNFGSAVISIVGVDKSGSTILDGEGSHSGFSSTGNITLNGLVLQDYINSTLAWKPTISYSLLKVSNCTFVGNQGDKGGALLLQPTASTVTAAVNASFIGNVANGYGGAIYALASVDASNFTLKIGANAQFMNNIAAKSGDGHGGAISAHDYVTLTIGDSAQFVNNIAAKSGDGYGGAISAYDYVPLTIGDSAHFVNNIAAKSGDGYGGAISAHDYVTLTIGDSAHFVNNIAAKSGDGNGGALSVHDNATLTIGNNAQFVKNTASKYGSGEGGAIYAEARDGYSNITLAIGKHAQFLSNAISVIGDGHGGGAILIHAYGEFTNVTLTMGDNALLMNNTAVVKGIGGGGGAIHAETHGDNASVAVAIGNDTQFVSNTAIVSGFGGGGAIYTFTAGDPSSLTLRLGDNTRFVNNAAIVNGTGGGGAIIAYAPGSPSNITITIGDNVQFVNNSAFASEGGLGGAVNAYASGDNSGVTLMIGDNARFANNTAGGSENEEAGGAIWAFAEAGTILNLLISKNASFLYNDGGNGGVMYLSVGNSRNFTTSIGANARYVGASGFRIAATKSVGSFCIAENSIIEIPQSFLSVSLFQRSVFNVTIFEATSVNCTDCISIESFDKSRMQLSIVNSSFVGIVNYALSVLGVGAGKQADIMHIDIVSSSFVGTSGASAILATASNVGNILITAVDCDFASFSSESDGGAIQVIAVANSTLDVEIQNCRFKHSSALDDTNGGSIASTCFSSQCSIGIANSSFENSTAALGGALAMLDDGGSTCTLLITNSSFNDCSATVGGGAIYSKRTNVLNVTSTSFVSNVAYEGNTKTLGGAIYATGCTECSLNINSCNFNGNEASSGGAIAMSDFVTSVLDATSFSSNRAITGNGGAIALTDEGNLITVRDGCNLIGNYADQSGGAVYVSGDSDGKRSLADFRGVSCQRNSATMGGCIFTDKYTNLTLESTFLASDNSAYYGADVAATDIIESSAKLSSEPKYDAPHCLKLPKQPIEVSPGIDASGQFTFEIIDVHGRTVENVDSSYLIEVTSEDRTMTVAGGSKTVNSKSKLNAGKIAFGDIAFISETLHLTKAKFGVTPPFSPQCKDMPTLNVQLKNCSATYYLNEGKCVVCPDDQYQLDEGSKKCTDCGFGGKCLDGLMIAAPGYWCETRNITVEGKKKTSCDKESRLYKCMGPGCLGGNTSKEQDKESFAVECDEKHGYMGLLCAECKDGYIATANECVDCALNPSRVIHALVALASIIAFIFYTLSNAGLSSALLALTLFYIQNVLLLSVSFGGLTLGILGTILDTLQIKPEYLIPVSLGLSLLTFCGLVLALGFPPVVRLLRHADFKSFSWQQLALAGISGNISLAALCISVGIAVSLLQHDVRLIVLVILLLILLPVLIAVAFVFMWISILMLLRRSLPFVNQKGAAMVAASALGCGIIIFCSLFVVVYYTGIEEEIKNIDVLKEALQFSLPFLTFVLPTVANLDISAALLELTETCDNPYDYYVRFVVELLNPVLNLGILWLVFPGSLLLNWGLGFLSKKTHYEVGTIREYIHNRMQLRNFTIASLELFLRTFTKFTTIAVGFFACRFVKDKGWFLNQENSVECYSWNNPLWVLYAPLAFFAVVWAVVLLPIAYLGILTITRFQKEWLQLKSRLGYDDSKRLLVALFEVMHWIAETFQFQLVPTHPNTYFWPVTIVLRRIFIVVVYVTLVQGDLQIAGAVILALFYFMFVLIRDTVNPFAVKTLNLLEAITLIFLGVCAVLYVLVDISLLYTDTNGDIYYSGITDVIQFLFWPFVTIPVLAAAVIWVMNLSPRKTNEDAKDAGDDNVDDNSSSSLGLSLSPHKHADPLKEALLTPDNEDEDTYL